MLLLKQLLALVLAGTAATAATAATHGAVARGDCPGSRSGAAGRDGGSAAATQYNVLLYVIDTLRADHLGLYGYERDTSPFIDQLAQEGVRWNDFHSASTWTWPSVVSMISSATLPTSRCPDRSLTLHPHWDSLPGILADRGYHTALISSNATLWPDGRVAPLYQTVEKPTRPDQGLTNRLATMLRDPSQRPFFIHAQPFGVHTPYECPAPFDSLFIGDPFYGQLGDVPRINPTSSCTGGISPDVVIDGILSMDWYVSQYDGLIAYMDWQVEQIFAVLEEQGLRENTLVIITSDHGEELAGEHDRYFCHADHYEGNIHVPLLILFPEAWQREHGPFRDLAIDGPCGHIDLMPTILDVLGIAPPPYLQGRDLVADPVQNRQAEFDHSGRAYRKDHYKLINRAEFLQDDPNKELFDLATDPAETNNLAVTDSSLATRMENQLNRIAAAVDAQWPPRMEQTDWSFFSDFSTLYDAKELMESIDGGPSAKWEWLEVGGDGMLHGFVFPAGDAAAVSRGPESRGRRAWRRHLRRHDGERRVLDARSRSEAAAVAADRLAAGDGNPRAQVELYRTSVAVIAPPLYQSRAQADIELVSGRLAFEIASTQWGTQRYRLVIEENQLTLQRFAPGVPALDWGTVAYPYGLNQWRHVTLESDGDTVRVVVDGEELFRELETDPTAMWGTTYFKIADDGGEVYLDNVSVVALSSGPRQSPPIEWPLPGRVPLRDRATNFTAPDPARHRRF